VDSKTEAALVHIADNGWRLIERFDLAQTVASSLGKTNNPGRPTVVGAIVLPRAAGPGPHACPARGSITEGDVDPVLLAFMKSASVARRASSKRISTGVCHGRIR
jgi:hypothetical protein